MADTITTECKVCEQVTDLIPALDGGVCDECRVKERRMKIYRLSQTLNNDYDTYDSCIVCAENEDEARKIHPSEYVTHYKNGKWYGTYTEGGEYETEDGSYPSWVQCSQIDEVIVEYIGEADKTIKKGVILSSFNAG